MTEKKWKMFPVDEEALRKEKHMLLCMQRHSWEHGVTMQAFLEADEMETVIMLSKAAACRKVPDGRMALLSYPNAVTDPCSVGEAVQTAWQKTGDQELGLCLDELKNWMYQKAPRNVDGILYHLDDTQQFWADSMYMLPPVMAALGNPEEGIRQMEGYWNALYDSKSGLIKHMWNDAQQTYDRDLCWGVGNGWALSGLARLIDLVPEELQEKKEALIEKATLLLKNVLKYRCSEGFHDIVDDQSSFIEVNLAQMTAYTIYRGICSGWLKTEEWLETAEELRKLCEDNLDEYGIIRNVCGTPDFNQPGTAPEAQAFYIMMEVAAQKVMHVLNDEMKHP